MAPIRVGLIGLSASATTSWASRAHLPYLLSPRGQEKYLIVALCNSSVEAASKAIAAFGLPSETRAYGNPDDLAGDEDVDLVVCNTRVDRHYETILPSLAAGKSVFCEWPLAQDIEHVRTLVDMARQKKLRTAIGTQGRLSPVAVKIRELLERGRIGHVLSSQLKASGGLNGRDRVPETLSYFMDRSVGGSVYTIGFGHVFDLIQSVLGEFQNIQSQLQLQRPNVTVLDGHGTVVRTTKSTVPDLVNLTATLTPSRLTQDVATLQLTFRSGQPFPGEPPLVWSINGEKGEIRLRAEAGTSINASATPVTIEIHDFSTDQVENIEWSWEDWQNELPAAARNIGLLYEAFATGDETAYPSFEDALRRHEQLEDMLARWEE